MIKKLELMIPSSYLLTIFDSIVKPIYKEESYLSSQIRLLTEARDRLLPKLMSGEIAV
jgi:type I restriction enzyme S subunit